MKKDWKYILYLSLAFGVFVAVKLTAPRQFDWTPTFSGDDKNPYGAWVLHELLPDLFRPEGIERSNLTVYELKDSLKKNESVLILTERYPGEKEDDLVLLKHAEQGGTVFIGAESFRGTLRDTFHLSTRDYLFTDGLSEQFMDSAYLKILNQRLDTTAQYTFRRDHVHNYFDTFDSTRTSIVAENDGHDPVVIKVKWGKGSFILCSTPLIFTNIYALREQNHLLLENILSYLPETGVHWTEYYSTGRMESQTPLRFILTQEPLAWAYYILVASLLLFMIFEAKRKQRIIPIVPPLENTSLEFVGTIGSLYFHRGDHRNIAEKKILFFLDYIRTRYSLNFIAGSENFISNLSGKSGKGQQEVRELFGTIESIRARTIINKEELIKLNSMLEAFTSKPYG